MKNIMYVIVGLIVGAGITYGIIQNTGKNVEPDPFKSDSNISNYSYFIGVTMGRNFLAQQLNISYSNFYDGFISAYTEKELRLNEAQLEEARNNLVTLSTLKREATNQQEIAENKKAGEKFLKENLQNPETKVLDSGLQYRVLQNGDGLAVADTAMVKVHYEGRTLDNNIFDSSYERGAPLELESQPNNVIPAWKEILQLMKVNDEFEIYVPSDLGYGDQGYPPVIPPATTLIFKIKIIEAN